MKLKSMKNIVDSGKNQVKSYEQSRKEKSEKRAQETLKTLFGKK